MPQAYEPPPTERKGIKEWVRNELKEAAKRITTAQELADYAAEFPSPYAGSLLLRDLRFFAEPKVVNGRRDGKKIWEHIELGFGPRLVLDLDLTKPAKRDWDSNLIIGIGLWLEKRWLSRGESLSSEMTYRERITHKKDYGVEDPRELIYEFLYYLGYELNAKTPPRITR